MLEILTSTIKGESKLGMSKTVGDKSIVLRLAGAITCGSSKVNQVDLLRKSVN